METGADILNSGLGLGLGIGVFLFIFVLIIGLLALDAIALWKAARRGSKGWFVLLLFTNTIVLELLYIFVFSQDQPETVVDHQSPQPPASNNPTRPV
ncbi:MAG: DUF5652 family protein [Patescibacteria group bacterium]